MIIRTLPDGTLIEITSTGTVTGPDQKGGQHFGMNYPYYRVDGGPWRNWYRSMHRLVEWGFVREPSF